MQSHFKKQLRYFSFVYLLHFSFEHLCGVKSISFILSFMTLVMILSPCADGSETDDTSLEVISTLDDSHQHDACSPFCSCHCCHSHVTQLCVLCSGEYDFFISLPSVQSFPLLSRISFSIWDPPPFVG